MYHLYSVASFPKSCLNPPSFESRHLNLVQLPLQQALSHKHTIVEAPRHKNCEEKGGGWLSNQNGSLNSFAKKKKKLYIVAGIFIRLKVLLEQEKLNGRRS